MIGFITEYEAPFGLSGDILQLKINSPSITSIYLPASVDNISALVVHLNSTLVGATAYRAYGSNKLIIRSNIRTAPGVIEIVGGSALAKMGVSTKIISERSHAVKIGSVNFPLQEFEDKDGVLEDFYGLSTVDTLSNESNISSLRQAINFTGPICVIEGCITDLQGMRVPDVKVLARVVTPPAGSSHTSIIKKEVYTLSGEDGRFSLPVLQNARVIFEIDETRVSDPITIPEAPYVFFDDLPIDQEYKLMDRSI